MQTEFPAPVLLTVRGTTLPPNVDAARVLHNETAGSDAGREAARALGDLSHCVYLPVDAGALSDANVGELLFLDVWRDPSGLQTFFADHGVQQQAGRMFSSREGAVWMPGRGGFSFAVPTTQAAPARFVGLFRAKVSSPEAAIAAFATMAHKALPASRRRGLLSHTLYVKMGAAGEPAEVLGVDHWTSLEGLQAHYQDKTAMQGIGDVLRGPPSPSVWQQAVGLNEW